MSASVIEATDIYLENTTAQTVRGARVKIGPNCRIDRVEYSETFALDPASKILPASGKAVNHHLHHLFYFAPGPVIFRSPGASI